MTADTLAKISDFLRDTEVRVGHLTYLINSLMDEGSLDWDDAYRQRKALMDFYEILNDRYALPFKDSTSITTFLQAPPVGNMDTTKYPAWTDREIVDEIDYLRWYGQLTYTTGTSVGYFTKSITSTAVVAPLLSLLGFWDPNINNPLLADTVVPAQGSYYLVINADDGVRFKDPTLFGNSPIVFFTNDIVYSTGTVWKVLRGDRFAPTVELQQDVSASPIVFDLQNLREPVFYASASIAGPKTWSLANAVHNRKFSFKFTLTDAWVQTLPASVKMSDVQWDPVAKTWSPIEGGEYLAEGTLSNSEWLVRITGPYI